MLRIATAHKQGTSGSSNCRLCRNSSRGLFVVVTNGIRKPKDIQNMNAKSRSMPLSLLSKPQLKTPQQLHHFPRSGSGSGSTKSPFANNKVTTMQLFHPWSRRTCLDPTQRAYTTRPYSYSTSNGIIRAEKDDGNLARNLAFFGVGVLSCTVATAVVLTQTKLFNGTECDGTGGQLKTGLRTESNNGRRAKTEDLKAVGSSSKSLSVTDTPQSDPHRRAVHAIVCRAQDEICEAIAAIENGEFHEDSWERAGKEGGGRSRVMQNGKVFEKAGVNVSEVFGKLPAGAAKQMRSRGIDLPEDKEAEFYATGVSLVIHPHNPNAPTAHANYRFFEITHPETEQKIWWFGGGADLTPAYLFEEDAEWFHRVHMEACDRHDPSYYSRFKKWCDEYFYIPHRGETRGVGGIFFDDVSDRPMLADPNLDDKESLMAFIDDCAHSFIRAYVPILEKRINMPYDEEQKRWQAIRRGRYVEYNLVYDRGTKFGLQTPNARIESILMSLPLHARWEYCHEPTPGSEEARLLQVLQNPKEWVVDSTSPKVVRSSGSGSDSDSDSDASLLQSASFSSILGEINRRASSIEDKLNGSAQGEDIDKAGKQQPRRS